MCGRAGRLATRQDVQRTDVHSGDPEQDGNDREKGTGQTRPMNPSHQNTGQHKHPPKSSTEPSKPPSISHLASRQTDATQNSLSNELGQTWTRRQSNYPWRREPCCSASRHRPCYCGSLAVGCRCGSLLAPLTLHATYAARQSRPSQKRRNRMARAPPRMLSMLLLSRTLGARSELGHLTSQKPDFASALLTVSSCCVAGCQDVGFKP